MMTQTTKVAKEYTLSKGKKTNFEYIQIYNTPPSYNLFNHNQELVCWVHATRLENRDQM